MWSPTVRSNELYLRHAGGAIKSNNKGKFKYIAKMGEGNNTRYFYSQEEIDAYKKTLTKDQLEKTDIQMLTKEQQSDLSLVKQDELQKQIAAEKAKKEAENAKPEEKKEEKKEEEEDKDKDKDKKKKSGSGGGKGKGGSGKGGKGKGKSKGKGKGDKKEKTPKLPISEMDDDELLKYLEKHKDLTKKVLKDLGLPEKTNLKTLKKTMDDKALSVDTESLYDAFKRLEYVSAPNKKKVKHSAFWSPSPRPDELYHWGFWGRNKEDHKYIEKIKEGNHYRYFYSKEELDAYRKLKNEVENKPVKTEGTSVIGKAKHFVDYDLTGRGYKRDAREQNKKIDQLNEMRKAHPLKAGTDELMRYRDKKLEVTSDKSGGKKEEVERRQKLKEIEQNRMDYINNAERRDRTIDNTSEFEKRRNLEKAESDFKEKSIVGKATKIGDTVRKFNRNVEDAKVANFMNKNRGTSEQWMKDLKIDKKDYDPEKDKGASGSNKLKKVLRERAMLREDETLNEFLEKHGYAENSNGERKYYRNKIKHFLESDLELYSLIVDSEELMHHGRKGMKWYQHIYGPFQTIAKYARGAGSKISEAKAAHDVKAEAKWEKKKEKIIRSGDAKQIRKISEKLTDDELRRADNRINEKTRLDSLNGKNIQQGKNYVQQQGNQQSRDLIKDFNNLANTISTTYNSVDKILTTIDSMKKYTPEGRAKEALKKDILKNNDIDKALDNWNLLNNKEQQDLINSVNNKNALFNYQKGEVSKKSNLIDLIGPPVTEKDNPEYVQKWLDEKAKGYVSQKSKNTSEEEILRILRREGLIS